jgi:hypothetical protein
VVAWVGLPLLGAPAGWLVDLAAGWASEHHVPLLHGIVRLLSLGTPLVAAGLGAAAGLVLAGFARWDELIATVGAGRATLNRAGKTRELARDEVVAVFLAGRDLVLLGADSRELAREQVEKAQAGPLQAAFTGQGWPWLEADPFAGEFRLWVAGLPGLPPGGDALLLARSKFAPDKRDDREELRQELARLGVVVRDEGRKQYVRTVALS